MLHTHCVCSHFALVSTHSKLILCVDILLVLTHCCPSACESSFQSQSFCSSCRSTNLDNFNVIPWLVALPYFYFFLFPSFSIVNGGESFADFSGGNQDSGGKFPIVGSATPLLVPASKFIVKYSGGADDSGQLVWLVWIWSPFVLLLCHYLVLWRSVYRVV